MSTQLSNIYKANIDAIWKEVILIVNGSGYQIIQTNEASKSLSYRAGGGGWAWAQDVTIDLSKVEEGKTLVSFFVEAAGTATLTEGGQQKKLINFMVDQLSEKFQIDTMAQAPRIANAPGAGCFTGESLVKTYSGNKMIKYINPGDRIFSVNVNGKIVEREVLSTVKHTPKNIIKVTFENGQKLSATKQHRVLCDNGWIKLCNISSGDNVYIVSSCGKIKSSKVSVVCKEPAKQFV